MGRVVTYRAERDEVLFRVTTGLAVELDVMNLQVRHRATRLTTPAIATQHLLSQPFVRHLI